MNAESMLSRGLVRAIKPVLLTLACILISTASFADTPFTVSPTSLTFNAQEGAAAPAAQTVTINAGTAANFTATIGAPSGWLSISGPSGSPPTVTVNVNQAGLGQGTFVNSFNITPVAGSGYVGVATVTVTLVVGSAQTGVVASPTSLTFSYQTGGSLPPAQSVTISSGTILTFSATAISDGWLTVSPNTGVTPVSVLSVSIYPGLLPAGSYQGRIDITQFGTNTVLTTIPVTFTITGTLSTITATPNTLSFASMPGGNPPVQTFFVSSTTATSYTTSIPASATWLTISSGASGTLPATVTVQVIPTAGLFGNNSANILITGNNNETTTVQVNLTVTTIPTLVASPQALTFSYNVAGSPPPSQNISLLSSSDTVTAFTVSTNAGWLQAVPISGNLPQSIAASINTAGLNAGTYNGKIFVTAPGASNSPLAIDVTLSVGGNTGYFTANPSTLVFSYQVGTATPASQILTITSNQFSTFSIASDSSWLSTNPIIGSTLSAITVTVNPAGLGNGTYSGHLTISPLGGTFTPQQVPVTLIVGSGTFAVTPSIVLFSFPTGAQPPSPQTLSVNWSGGQNFTASASVFGGVNWLSVTPVSGAVPGSTAIYVNTAGLTDGVYTGQVVVNISGPFPTSQTVPVTLTVGTGVPLFSFNPTSINLNSSKTTERLFINTANAASVQFSASATSVGGWLSISMNSGTAPTQIIVTANPNLISTSNTGTITITGGGTTQQVPVTFTVVPGGGGPLTLSLDRTSVQFSSVQGGSAPAAQSVQLTSAGGSANFSVASSNTWLAASPMSGSTPATISVSVNPGNMPAGTYEGTLTFTAAGSSNISQLNVTLVISAPPSVVADKDSLGFSYRSGEPSPNSQSISVSSPGGSLTFSVAVQSSGWLLASPMGGTTPATLTVSAAPGNLAPGTYSGTISITGTGANTVVLPVTFAVAGPLPTITRVTSAASGPAAGFAPGQSLQVAPGEILTITGDFIGPADLVKGEPQDNVLGSTLANTRVLFARNSPGAILSASSTEVVAIVPYGVPIAQDIIIQVEYLGVRSNAVTVTVARSAPGLFTADGSGTGQVSAKNADGSPNSPDNPADPESVVVLSATGDGLQDQTVADGAIIQGPPYPKPLLPVSVLFDGVAVPPGNIVSAGATPTGVAGQMQVTVKLPAGIHGQVGVTLMVGTASSQSGVFLSVK